MEGAGVGSLVLFVGPTRWLLNVFVIFPALLVSGLKNAEKTLRATALRAQIVVVVSGAIF